MISGARRAERPESVDRVVARLDRATLEPLVAQTLRVSRAELIGWRGEAITYERLNPVSGGLFRIRGRARAAAEADAPWSLVLKIIRPSRCPEEAKLSGRVLDAFRDAMRWDREALAYRSVLLDSLPGGLAAPRCFAVADGADGSIWLWLEDVREAVGSRWPLARFRLAARHLGAFNGAYLAGRALPAEAWLTRRGLRAWVDSYAHLLPLIDDQRSWDHEIVRRAFAPGSPQELLRLWGEREALLRALERLPRALCHLDAFRWNLIARRAADGRDETVALDWAVLGIAAAGEESGQLVAGSFLFPSGVPAVEARRLDEAVFAGYCEGLREAGWQGDTRLVRFGHVASAALRWALVAPHLELALEPRRRAEAERRWRRPIAALLAHHAWVTRFLLDCAAEARSLGDQLAL